MDHMDLKRILALLSNPRASVKNSRNGMTMKQVGIVEGPRASRVTLALESFISECQLTEKRAGEICTNVRSFESGNRNQTRRTYRPDSGMGCHNVYGGL